MSVALIIVLGLGVFVLFRELQLWFITVLWMYEGLHWVSEPRV